MSNDGEENRIGRRKFPAIAFGITGICIALVVILLGVKYFGPAPREPITLIPSYTQ